MLNTTKIRQDFPLLHRVEKNGNPLVYLDNAATTQKPQVVIDSLIHFYTESNANIHRGIYNLAQEATDLYENARRKVQTFLNAQHSEEIVFVKGTTEAINLVAQSFLAPQLKENDEILITAMEHHANLVPWQQLAQKVNAKLKVVPITEIGELDLNAFEEMLSEKVKLLAVVHISNTLGTVNPIEKMIELAHQKGIPTLVDGVQSVAHQAVDVQKLNCDFFTFSGHKVFAPMGVGVLYAKKQYLEKMQPYQLGGEMIRSVSFEKTTYNKIPHKFEAGTPNVAGAVALGAALNYLQKFAWKDIQNQEQELLLYTTQKLQQNPKIKIIGEAENKASVISFVMEDVHPHDIGTILNEKGVAVRAGHHCTMPLMQFFKIPGTVRASFSFYNTLEEIDTLVEALQDVHKIFV